MRMMFCLRCARAAMAQQPHSDPEYEMRGRQMCSCNTANGQQTRSNTANGQQTRSKFQQTLRYLNAKQPAMYEGCMLH
jgi:hypothetical protein